MADLPEDVGLLRAVVDSLGLGLYAIDGHGRVLAANATTARLLGWAENELVGASMHAVVHGADVEEGDCPIVTVARTGKPARSESDVFRRRDGTSLAVSWVATPLRGASGAAVVFDDVGGREQAVARTAHLLAEEQAARMRQREAAGQLAAANDRLALLAQLGEALTTLDVDDALRRVARLVAGRVADWCVVDSFSGGTVTRVAVSLGEAPAPSTAPFRRLLPPLTDAAAGSLARVLQGGEAMLVTDFPDPDADPSGTVDPLDAEQLRLFRDLGAASALVVPLRARHQVLGAMTWVRRDAATAFHDEDVLFATELGRRAGLALDNARLFGLQRQAAEALQRSLLTRLPEPDHLHVAARYLPAGEGAEVGGDWYDAFMLPDGALCLVIGDVVGHDMTAAARMAQLRNLLRGVAFDREEPASEVLRRVDVMMAGLPVDALATAVLARVDQTAADRGQGRRWLRWSNAGHLPPLLLDTDGSVTLLDGREEGGTRQDDLLLGVDPFFSRTDHEHVLPPGSTLLLYTDGLIERRDTSLDVGLARLRQAVSALAHQPLDQLLDELLARLLPGGADDDVALLAVRAFPEDRPRPAEAGPATV